MDTTINLGDVQTGGVTKAFCGHTEAVDSVSISPNQTTIASGSKDGGIHLWGTWTGECYYVINGHNEAVSSLSFSPTNSQHFISASGDGTIKQWDVDGHQIQPTYDGNYITFSQDRTHFVSWKKLRSFATVQNSHSGVAVAELWAPKGSVTNADKHSGCHTVMS